jgi:hypothetical protein
VAAGRNRMITPAAGAQDCAEFELYDLRIDVI